MLFGGLADDESDSIPFEETFIKLIIEFDVNNSHEVAIDFNHIKKDLEEEVKTSKHKQKQK